MKRSEKPRRRIRPEPLTRHQALDPKPLAEYRHKKTGAVVHLVEIGIDQRRFKLFHYATGRHSWLSFESLFRNYTLHHRAIRAKVGTGPGTIVTLLQQDPPELLRSIQFVEMLNGKILTGYVDEIREVDGEPLYLIARL